MDAVPAKIGVIGCGMWGRNIVRNAASLGILHAVCDSHIGRMTDFADQFGCLALSDEQLFSDPEIDGVMLTSSAISHHKLALRALKSGKHVYIEKPMAMSVAEAEDINRVASQMDRQVMVGHLIRYHPVFVELQNQIKLGTIGQLRHIQANRLAMGRIRNTESVLFDLCPHDISLILAIAGQAPSLVRCQGISHITPGLPDILSTSFGFPSGLSAGMQTSWLNPEKEHKLTVIGTSGSLVFDDTRAWPEKLILYQDRIEANGEMFVIDRASPMPLPVAEDEPLKAEVSQFAHLCQTGVAARTNGEEGLAVQMVMEQMQNSYIDLSTPHASSG